MHANTWPGFSRLWFQRSCSERGENLCNFVCSTRVKKNEKKIKNKIQTVVTVVIIITRNENIKYNKRRFVFSRRRSIILCAEEMTKKKTQYLLYVRESFSLSISLASYYPLTLSPSFSLSIYIYIKCIIYIYSSCCWQCSALQAFIFIYEILFSAVSLENI